MVNGEPSNERRVTSNEHQDKPAGLYAHIPFCIKKCPYCDFYSLADPSLHQPFIDALTSEMHLRSPVALDFDSFYIGGGTPSIIDAGDILRVIDTAQRAFSIHPEAEITLEVNPGTITPEKLAVYRNGGVNRLNIGVQSFSPANLNLLGRVHTVEDADMALRHAREAGFENLGVDLIYGVPGQTETSWRAELHRTLEFEPEHLSCYMLTYEPGTPMDEDRQKGRHSPLTERKLSDFFETTTTVLERRGYVQYEISSFARTGAGISGRRRFEQNRSRHNRTYWSFRPYVGLGPSAHSFKEPERSWNRADVRQYISELAAGKLPGREKEVLSRSQLLIEAVYLGLRQTDGIDINAFEKKFALGFQSQFGDTLKSLEEKGFIRYSQNRCALTRKGMLYLDSIASMLVDW